MYFYDYQSNHSYFVQSTSVLVILCLCWYEIFRVILWSLLPSVFYHKFPLPFWPISHCLYHCAHIASRWLTIQIRNLQILGCIASALVDCCGILGCFSLFGGNIPMIPWHFAQFDGLIHCCFHQQAISCWFYLWWKGLPIVFFHYLVPFAPLQNLLLLF